MTTTFAQCIGIVPIDKTHFSSTLKHLRQPHAVSLHLEFLRRASAGRAVVTIRERKLGSRLSTIHISLSQQAQNGEARVEVEGYIIQSDITAEEGLSIPSAWSLYPPAPQADLIRLLQTGEDEHWFRQKPLFPHFRKVPQNVTFYVPRGGHQLTGLTDEWIRFQPGGVLGSGKWTHDSLGFVTDIFPHIVESHIQSQVRAMDPERSKLFDSVDTSPEDLLEKGSSSGDLVVISHHITLIYSTERNIAPRETAEKL
ncbi:hypothetical protein DL98DRAFT_552772 [Cadophora sp. DSE1049]|nr:hypothetical protein DL98DRAFT_552772 [Cadophora sp. DSE1049]